jgi:purine-binding chemotaxis protein CheW
MDDAKKLPYLAFGLADERYAIPVSQAAEVLGHARITRLPMSDSAFKGIIDLRGKGIPIVDLRIELRLDPAVPEEECSIVVLELPSDTGETRFVGALVDSVHEVVELDSSIIEPPPRLDSRGREGADFITGIARTESSFILIIDAEKFLDSGALARAASPAPRSA